MEYDIITYCSESYIDAFDVHITSWLNNTCAKHIYIYTDTDESKFKIKNKRIIIKPFYEKNDDWIDNVGRKIECVIDYLKSSKSKYVAFIEMDCYIVSEFDEVFNDNVDISVTRLFSTKRYTHGTVTCGLWFAQTSPPVLDFMTQWHDTSTKYKDHKIGIVPELIAYDQLSFTDLIRPAYVNGTLRVNALDENIYNCEHSKEDDLIEQLKIQIPKIIHFKGRRFRNNGYRKLVFDTLNIKEGKMI
jgi:hypothetical protein